MDNEKAGSPVLWAILLAQQAHALQYSVGDAPPAWEVTERPERWGVRAMHALLHERGGLGGDASHDRWTFEPVASDWIALARSGSGPIAARELYPIAGAIHRHVVDRPLELINP